MKWFTNVSLIMRSNFTSMCSKMDERTLHQLLIDMDHELETVREKVAGAIADEILLGKNADSAEKEVERWTDRARTAMDRDDETAAKAALEKKMDSENRATGLREEHAKQCEQTTKLRDAVHDLEGKIRHARQQQTLLLARLARADSTTRVNQALGRVDSDSAFAQFGRLQKRAERAEVMCEAYDRLDGKDPDADALEREFAKADRKEKIEAEFEQLKKRATEATTEET